MGTQIKGRKPEEMKTLAPKGRGLGWQNLCLASKTLCKTGRGNAPCNHSSLGKEAKQRFKVNPGYYRGK